MQKSDNELCLSLNFRRISGPRHILMEKHLKILSEFFKIYSTQMKILLGTNQNEVTQENWKNTSEWQLFLHNAIALLDLVQETPMKPLLCPLSKKCFFN